jgi:hypothetical protein
MIHVMQSPLEEEAPREQESRHRRESRKGSVRSRQLLLAAAIALLGIHATPASAQIPPRFYWKSLTGSHAVPVLGMSLSGNANPIDPGHTVVPGANFAATVVLTGYAHTFSLGGRAAMAAVLVPMGRLSGEATLGGLDFGEDASGYGDPLVELNVNLIGPSAVKNIPDLMRYEPGFSLDVIVDLTIPIGEYDSEKPLNLGQNRWYGRVGTPIVWQLGPWVPGRRTTLELLPSVWLYGDNADFLGRRLHTDPMFQVEGHLTRDLATDLWVSLDLTWVTGGRASLDGRTGEELNNLGAGITLGYHINDNLQLTAGYMATVNDEKPTDLRMDGFRVSLLFGWHPLVEGMKRLKAE